MVIRVTTIDAMEAELPPFKNEDHNSESASTLDRAYEPFFIFKRKGAWTYIVHLVFCGAGWWRRKLLRNLGLLLD